MTQPEKNSNKQRKRIRLIARILSVPIIAFALLMVVGYAVSWITTGTADPNAVEDYPFIENLPPIFMFIAIMGLAIAWFRERLGGLINICFCLATLPILLIHWPIAEDSRNIMPYVLVTIISIPGILFLVYWWRTKENHSNIDSSTP